MDSRETRDWAREVKFVTSLDKRPQIVDWARANLGSDGHGAGVYEVEVHRPDGSQIEVHLNGQFQPVGTVADDDSGSESEGAND